MTDTIENGKKVIVDTSDISSILWQSGTQVRYTLDASVSLASAVANTGMFLEITGATNSSNNGSYYIVAVSDGSHYVDVINSARTDATDDEATTSATAKVKYVPTLIPKKLTTTEGALYVGKLGEIFIILPNNVRLSDGSTPGGLGLFGTLANSQAVNGYETSLNRIIRQWAEEASFHDLAPGQLSTITLPITFPNAIFHSECSVIVDAASSGACVIARYSQSTSQIVGQWDEWAAVVQTVKMQVSAIGN